VFVDIKVVKIKKIAIASRLGVVIVSYCGVLVEAGV